METLVMLADLITRINEDKARAQEHVRAGASAAQLATLKGQSLQVLGIEPPAQYLDFLRLSNGLDYNGLVVYDCASTPEQRSAGGFWQGLVATNLHWRDSAALRHLLVLADSDMDVFALDPADGRFHQIDKVGKDSMASFDSFNEMMEEVLAQRLG